MDAQRDEFRSGLTRRDDFMHSVPRWYRGQAHFALTNVFSLAILALSLRGMTRPSWAELLVAPAAFLFANYFEWRIHRGPLHRSTPGVRILYERHTLLHHAAFSAESMPIRDPREMRMVLFPFPALFGAALIDLPFAAAIGWLTTPNAGRIFYAVAFGYYLLYEWCHLAFHMPPDSWLGNNPITRRLRTTHTRHHDPRLMARKNFNVTFPIFDAIMGTLER